MLALTAEEEILRSKCQGFLRNIQASASHSTDHAEKVLGYALKLAKETNANKSVLIASCLHHDVSRQYGHKGVEHGEKSSELISDFLQELCLSSQEQSLIMQAISNHSLKIQKQDIPIESKILYDADKLAGFGMLGFIRICMYAGEKNLTLAELCNKFLVDLPRKQNCLHLEKSKKLAEKLNIKLERIREFLKEEELVD